MIQKKYLAIVLSISLLITLSAQQSPNFSSLCNSGLDSYRKNQFQPSIDFYKQALVIQPTNPKLLFNIGYLFYIVGNREKAIVHLKQSVKSNPNYTKARHLLADLYTKTNKYEPAIEHYQHIVQQNPNDIATLYTCATLLKITGRYDEAIAYYEQLVTLQPSHNNGQLGFAKALLATGNFEKGWQQFEWRMYTYKPENNIFLKMNIHDLQDKVVLLRAEFGLGDMIQFIRYAKLLKQNGVKQLIVESPAPLIPLFSLCRFIDKVVQKGTVPTNVDFTIPLLTLPLICKTEIENIDQTVPYLQAGPELSFFWEQTLRTINPQKKILNVGVCWHASPDTFLEQNRYTKRSIELSAFAPIANLANVKLYSLQKIDGTEEINKLPGNFIHVFDDNFDESNGRFMDTAAVIQNLDLVLTVDTSIAHLAGALATPVWILLPKAAEWRWELEETETPWYPTAKLFRQKEHGNWQPVIEEIRKRLADC